MNLFSKAIDILYPKRCRVCDSFEDVSNSLCKSCRTKYAREAFEKCSKCANTASRCTCTPDFALETKTAINGRYYSTLTFYKNSAKRADSDRITEKMILSLKTRGDFARFFAVELARMLRSEFEKANIDLSEWTLTYAPRSVKKYLECGLDQGDEVTRYLARELGIKRKLLFARSQSVEQKNLSRTERTENANESFIVRRHQVAERGKYILFDDIITTGATISSASRLLYEAGAAAVYPISIAKTK
ncbi:MAG: ComF family protein [Clostridia bacterium]|nr:ComF family protein [Clostridia bacterium]